MQQFFSFVNAYLRHVPDTRALRLRTYNVRYARARAAAPVTRPVRHAGYPAGPARGRAGVGA